MDKFLKDIGAGVLVIVALVLLAGLSAYPLKCAINYLVNPQWLLEAFGTPHIGFWQAFSLNYIAGALIKGTPAVSSK